MQLSVKVVQSRELFDTVSGILGARDGWAARFIAAHGMSSRLTFSAGELRPEDLLCFPDFPTVIVAEVRDLSSLNRMCTLTNRLHALLKENDGLPLMVAPFVAILAPRALTTPENELPEFVSEWMLEPIDDVELTHRILSALRSRKRKQRKVVLQFGELNVLPDARMITYSGTVKRFSPSEFALAELFFSRMGSVISLAELTAFFNAAGKSTEPNNIRVTIHQLRLKLEELTRSHLSLSTIYRRGYCLRQSSRASGGDEAAGAVASRHLD